MASKEDARLALAATMAEGLRPISLGLVALYAYYSVDNLLVLPPEAGIPTSVVAFVTTTILLLFHLRLRRKPLPDAWAHATTAAMAGLILVNSLVFMGYTLAPYRTINLAFLIIGAGCCMLSTEWFALTVAAALFCWEVVAWALDPPRVGIHFDYTLFKATILASVVQVVRVRTYRRLEGLRAREAAARAELEQALGVVQEARGAAEASNQELGRAMLEVRESEERARRTSQALETVVEACPLPIVTLDPDGRLQWWNSAAEELLGGPAPDREGRERLLLPPELEQACGEIGRREASRRTVTGAEVQCEMDRGRRLDLRLFAAPLPEGERNPGGLVVVLDDITERKRLESAAREEHLRSLMANASDVVLLTDRKGTIRYVGPSIERALGYTQEDLLDTPASRWIHTDDWEQVEQAFAQLRRTPGSMVQIEHRVRHSDGSWRVMEAVGTNRLNHPADAGLVVNLHDVTERRRLEEDLRQAQKMEAIGRLAAGVAHDFNNMLNVIIGYTDLLIAQHRTGSPTRESLEEIGKAADRAASLTRQLLAFSRKQLLTLQVLDLNDVIAGIDPMLRRVVGEDIQLVTHLAPGLGPVRADRGQFEQILMNLTANARDAMPLGGRLTIETSRVDLDEAACQEHPGLKPGPYTRTAIHDTGSGMSEETLSHLFEPFYTTRELGQGTGLGLATVYGIVRQSDGQISVSSEVGRGTTFYVDLPCIAPEASPA